ncbi:hypothetical protein PGT21_002133 [Puccinia graminis f. sp. tritici]|uniref:Uncharacterized protein n=1 Tax=Puccinia graminis f. sp. tritici TaxID=56615 RepID=A0A5B0MTK0_PUCGR|nr:hypothetical protein PGTUg99_006272 [Puccinia graminis f. sp. tritici]KAA1080315.1 hypothetical protein PGT21_002133 [Puccinia graminis f. sp. tritici]
MVQEVTKSDDDQPVGIEPTHFEVAYKYTNYRSDIALFGGAYVKHYGQIAVAAGRSVT